MYYLDCDSVNYHRWHHRVVVWVLDVGGVASNTKAEPRLLRAFRGPGAWAEHSVSHILADDVDWQRDRHKQTLILLPRTQPYTIMPLEPRDYSSIKPSTANLSKSVCLSVCLSVCVCVRRRDCSQWKLTSPPGLIETAHPNTPFAVLCGPAQVNCGLGLGACWMLIVNDLQFICRNICCSTCTFIGYQTPSVALAPLALIYRATYAVQQSPQQRSRP